MLSLNHFEGWGYTNLDIQLSRFKFAFDLCRSSPILAYSFERAGRTHGLQATGLGAPGWSVPLLYRPAPEPGRWAARSNVGSRNSQYG